MTETHRPGCLEANMLAEYIDGGLEPRERAKVEEHLAECGECYENFAESVRLTASAAAVAPARTSRSVWRLTAFGAVAASVVGLLTWQVAFRGGSSGVDRALSDLSNHAGRFAQARLSESPTWRPAPSATRGPADKPSLAVQKDAIRLQELMESERSWATLRGAGIASLALGEVDRAIDLLTEASAANPESVTTHVDLSAALLERWRAQQTGMDATRALNEATVALQKDQSNLAGLFNQALAYEALGLSGPARNSWNQFASKETDASWKNEAAEHLRRLQSPAGAGASLSQQYREVERALAGWNGQAATIPEAARAASSILTRQGGDPWLPRLLDAAASRKSDRERACLTDAVHALSAWYGQFEVGLSAESAPVANNAVRALSCASLPDIEGRMAEMLAAFDVGRFEEAEKMARVLEPRATQAGYLRAASRARQIVGLAAAQRRHMSDAMQWYQVAHDAAVAVKDHEFASVVSGLMAELSNEQGDSMRAWSQLSDALPGADEFSSLRRRYNVLSDAVHVSASMGLVGATVAMSDVLVSATHEWQNPGGRVWALLQRSEALAALGRNSSALADVAEAETILPSIPQPAFRDDFGAHLRLARGRLLTATDPARAIDDLTAALAYFDRTKNQALLAPVLYDRGMAFERGQRVADAQADWQRGLALLNDQRPEIRDQQLRISRLDRVWKLHRALVGSLVDREPQRALDIVEAARARELLDATAHGAPVAPLSGPGIFQWLPPGAVALSYAVLPDRLLIWKLTAEGSQLTERTISENALTTAVESYVSALRRGSPQHDAALSRLLLPEGLSLTPDSQLLVVPDGVLHRLPFQTLWDEKTRTFLVERTTIVVAPSLSMAKLGASTATRRDARALIAGVGLSSAADHLPALPTVRSEIDALGALYPRAVALDDRTATRTALIRDFQSHTVVHFSGHAIVDDLRPFRSRLLTAPENGGNSISVEDIASLRLDPSTQVVLGACNSGSGTVFHGEGAVTLARAFLAAGASSVVGSLWEVSDSEAARFLNKVHRRLASGEPLSVALAGAQRDAIRASDLTSWSPYTTFGHLTRMEPAQ